MALTFSWTDALLPRGDGRGLLALGALLGLAIGVAVVAVFPDAHPHALNAAGAFKGEEIAGVAKFVSKLKGSLVWLGGTAMGLVIAVVGDHVHGGSLKGSRRGDQTVAGLAILASISGIVA